MLGSVKILWVIFLRSGALGGCIHNEGLSLWTGGACRVGAGRGGVKLDIGVGLRARLRHGAHVGRGQRHPSCIQKGNAMTDDAVHPR